MEALTPFANADQTVLDNLNGDQAFKVIVEVFGVPQEIVRTAKDVAGVRDARAKAQQAALDAEAAKEQADAAPKVTQAMGQVQAMAGNGG